jgi:hypothetical protein
LFSVNKQTASFGELAQITPSFFRIVGSLNSSGDNNQLRSALISFKSIRETRED